MNLRRWPIRLWITGTLIWFACVAWMFSATSVFPDRNLPVSLVITFAPPLAVLGLGSAVAWVMRRVRREHRHD
jgi:hypothetical protein